MSDALNMKQRILAAVSATAITLSANGQLRIPESKPRCGGVARNSPKQVLSPLQSGTQERSGASPESADLCAKYTHAKGWTQTMQLYLGQGSDQYQDVIELPVKTWNLRASIESLSSRLREEGRSASTLKPTSGPRAAAYRRPWGRTGNL